MQLQHPSCFSNTSIGQERWRFSTVLRQEQRYPEGGDPLKFQGGRPAPIDRASRARAPRTHYTREYLVSITYSLICYTNYLL